MNAFIAKANYIFNKKNLVFVIPVIVIIAIIGYFYWYNSRYISTDDTMIKIVTSLISPQVSRVID